MRWRNFEWEITSSVAGTVEAAVTWKEQEWFSRAPLSRFRAPVVHKQHVLSHLPHEHARIRALLRVLKGEHFKSPFERGLLRTFVTVAYHDSPESRR